METAKVFLERRSLAVNIAINATLATLCAFSYIMLIALYLTQGLGLQSLRYVHEGTLPPTVAIPLLGVLLTGATSALLTRSVEHDLWISLMRSGRSVEHDSKRMDDESHQRAQWTVSPFIRLFYLFTGESWLLRISGLLLFGTALINPILLYGVRSVAIPDSITENVPASKLEFSGFLVDGGGLLDPEARPDEAMTIAQFASLANLGVPSTQICSEDSCVVHAHAAALQAECIPTVIWRPALPEDETVFCSTHNEHLCVTQRLPEDVGISYNFTNGPSRECSMKMGMDPSRIRVFDVCPAGDFTAIIGSWVNYEANDPDSSAGHTTHSVDCRVRYGSTTIQQIGGGAPSPNRTSFTQSTSTMVPPLDPEKEALVSDEEAEISSEDQDLLNMMYGLAAWQRRYVGSPSPWDTRSPFNFSISGDSDDAFPMLLLATELPRPANTGAFWTNDTKRVAEALERIFDTATLLAFARVPEAANLNITITSQVDTWTYDSRVLSILAAPLVATILVLCKHWRVQSNDVVIGYNPRGITRRAEELLASSSHTKELGSEGESGAFSTSRGTYAAVAVEPPSHEREGSKSGGEPALRAVFEDFDSVVSDRSTGSTSYAQSERDRNSPGSVTDPRALRGPLSVRYSEAGDEDMIPGASRRSVSPMSSPTTAGRLTKLRNPECSEHI